MSDLLDADMDIATVAKMAGHSSVVTPPDTIGARRPRRSGRRESCTCSTVVATGSRNVMRPFHRCLGRRDR